MFVFGVLFILYEDEILDFDKMIVVFFGWFGWVVLDFFVMIKEDFWIWIIWFGIVYGLEIIRCWNVDNVVIVEVGDFFL